MTRQRRKLSGIAGLVEREENQRQPRVVAEAVEQGTKVARVICRHGNVRAFVHAEALEQRAVVVAVRAGMKLHHQPVFDAHAGALDQQVTGEAPRLVTACLTL